MSWTLQGARSGNLPGGGGLAERGLGKEQGGMECLAEARLEKARPSLP